MTRLVFASLLLMPLAAAAADDGRVSFLEQEVRNLQRQSLALSRRIDELERRSTPLATAREHLVPETAASRSDAWLDAGSWRKLRPGMSELEVVTVLGPPTSMREIDGARVLFYAMEIGTSGFLGGSVKLRDRVVSEVRPPTLQ
jgi:hypothetical protein